MKFADSLLHFGLTEVVLVVLLGLIGWAAFGAMRIVRDVDQLPASYRAAQIEYLRIANHIQPAVDDLQQTLLRYETSHDPIAWETFTRKGRDLKAWVEHEKEAVPTMKLIRLQPVELTSDAGSLLTDIDHALEAYLASARGLVPTPADPKLGVSRHDTVDKRSRTLVALAALARSHGEAMQMFLTGSQEWLHWFRRVVIGSIFTLVACGGWVSLVTWQRVVSPLRRQLLESHTIIERQKKLAHFGELAAGVAHEIRNPLTAIKARLFTLEKGIPPDSPDREDAAVIRSELERLNRIVRDFLDLARPSEPRFASVSATRLLDEVHDLLATQYQPRAVRVRVEAPEDVELHADCQQIKQVLINLVQNAAESMPHGGTIVLRARNESHRWKGKSGPAAIIEVQDEGTGIPAAVQKRLFDPFFSTKEGGTGLGLSIAAHIVQSHGGSLRFQTHEGRGTTFSIALPLPPVPP